MNTSDLNEQFWVDEPGEILEEVWENLPVETSANKRPTAYWDPRLVLDLAVGVDSIEDILPRYNITEKEFSILCDTSSFRRDLALATKEVRDAGVSFELKARIQAETYLEEIDKMVYADTTAPGVKLEAIRSAVKWGGLEPKEAKESDAARATVNVQINF